VLTTALTTSARPAAAADPTATGESIAWRAGAMSADSASSGEAHVNRAVRERIDEPVPIEHPRSKFLTARSDPATPSSVKANTATSSPRTPEFYTPLPSFVRPISSTIKSPLPGPSLYVHSPSALIQPLLTRLPPLPPPQPPLHPPMLLVLQIFPYYFLFPDRRL